MGRWQRGVHFGAVGLKRVKKVANFLLQIFELLLTLFLNNSVILWQLNIKNIFEVDTFRF
jgi:hypothetical protein